MKSKDMFSSFQLPARNLDQMFSNSFSAEYQLLEADPKHDIYIACALLLRGANVTLSDVRRNIDKWVLYCIFKYIIDR